MVLAYYWIALGLSLALMIAYLFIWHERFDIHITLLFVLVPIANLSYLMLAQATSLNEAVMATQISYIGGCYLQLILMLAVFALCDIKVSRWVRVALVCLSTAVFLSVLTIGHNQLFYQSATLDQVEGVSLLHKQYGPLHNVFLVMVFAYFCGAVAAIIYSYLRKNQVSRNNIILLLLTEVVGIVGFFGGRQAIPGIEPMPLSFDFALCVYLVIAYRISLYDTTGSAIDSLVQANTTGFASFDFKLRYLGSNDVAKEVFPELNDLTVDRPAPQDMSLTNTVIAWMKEFAADETRNEHLHEKGDRTYRITVQHLYSGRRKKGYSLLIVDNTEDQHYIKLLNSFNTELQHEVDKKTAHIVEMHDNLIMSMAMMVESRDNSTGGHIRRTSEGVRLLVAQIRATDAFELSDDFCRNVVKAAPMHDLGKIAVDDAILRKPGRFDPEEFEIMKTHAAEGARIVHEILKGTDDDAFHRIAENVAHYHHERWDGSGYPEGLAGNDIPLEARIMAIADVYDALVSKRVYKDALSFEKADAIIMEGMGTQFDKKLEPCYVLARPHLEEYYRSLNEE